MERRFVFNPDGRVAAGDQCVEECPRMSGCGCGCGRACVHACVWVWCVGVGVGVGVGEMAVWLWHCPCMLGAHTPPSPYLEVHATYVTLCVSALVLRRWAV